MIFFLELTQIQEDIPTGSTLVSKIVNMLINPSNLTFAIYVEDLDYTTKVSNHLSSQLKLTIFEDKIGLSKANKYS